MDLDSLAVSAGTNQDMIDDFYTGKLWDDGLDGSPLKIGRLVAPAEFARLRGTVPTTKRGLYIVKTTDDLFLENCFLLSPVGFRSTGSVGQRRFKPDQVPGMHSKPYPGALCLVGTSQGGMAFILGFWNPPSTVATEGDDYTNETTPGVVDDRDARTAGDWLIRTENGLLNLKRGGSLVLECGATIRQTLNPDNGNHFTQSKSRIDVSEGYKLTRNRLKDTERETLSTEEFFDKILQRGQTATRIRIRNGRVSSSVRHELSIAEVNYATITDPIVSFKARERYFDDGSWVAEGPKFQWGGGDADEPIVLGNVLADIISDLCDIIGSITVQTAWGPSIRVLIPTPLDLHSKIKSKLKNFKSDYMFATKSPKSLRLVSDS
jgi:hypothetical protein